MKNLKRKLSAIVLSTVFAASQVAFASIDTGLENAVINQATGGFKDVTGGNGTANINFNGSAHVNWNTLNVGKGETLNFNAVEGANGITILNTVNNGMSTIYGQINSNDGVAKLIISNPNGMLFDGAKFTTAGDLMLTTKDLRGMTIEDLNNAKFTHIYDENGNINAITIRNGSEFSVAGEYTMIAPAIIAESSKIKANTLKLITSNGQDYLALGTAGEKSELPGVKLQAVNIDGNVYITAPSGVVKIVNGGTINGNLNVDAKGSVALNYKNEGEKLVVTKDVNVNNSGSMSFLRNAEVGGNLAMSNSGGFVDIGNVNVKGNADLKTTGIGGNGCSEYNHFVHVIGDTNIGGDLNIESSQNIHIGGYDYDAQKLATGNLKVGGDLNAHATDGHVTVTIDTQADKINLKSDKLNVLTDGKATLTANEYSFSSNGYIGGLESDERIVEVMEGYEYIADQETPSNVIIAGGKITNIETPENSPAYIASKGDVTLTGANAGNINITAPGKFIEITGDGVHAKNINVGKETDKLKVDFEGRDYTLNYTNIRDAKEVTIKGTDEITYELTNGENGYNVRDPRPENTTYLVGPAGPDEPIVPPTPGPDPTIDPEENENAKILRSYERPTAVDQAQPYTPIAYAADLEDDHIDTGVRKNVDGSVTVVRAFPMIN